MERQVVRRVGCRSERGDGTWAPGRARRALLAAALGLGLAMAVAAMACSDGAPEGACVGGDCAGSDTTPIGPDTEGDGVGDADDAGDDAPGDVEDLDVTDVGADGDAEEDADAELGPCSQCHGSLANAAPPVDTQGGSETSLRSVGAHQTHLRDGFVFRTVTCEDCHLVPDDVDAEGHLGELPAELIFGDVAGSDDVSPGYGDGLCNVYCHGVTLSGGTDTIPDWTVLDGTYNRCGACHGTPPAGAHPRVAVDSCAQCHPFEGGPENHEHHVDGVLDVFGTGECGGCHGLPPATGAHLAHVGVALEGDQAVYGDLRITRERFPEGFDGYAFGCGHCHPVDEASHFDGVVNVELHDPGLWVAPPYGADASDVPLKGRNPVTASYTAGTCSDVYCHSTGQAVPVFVTTPEWEGGALPEPRCAACHDNPPAYASGGAGADTANTHLVMADDGYEYGHFGGLPGPWHTSYHGTQRGSAPITCQTCHFATVDPTNTGPSGFYYLDTTGSYDLGGDLGYTCAAEGCHSAGSATAPLGEGAVLTGRHLDGARDVVFDPRTSLPAETPNVPSPAPPYPYWVGAVPNASVRPTGTDVQNGRWSFHLGEVDLGDGTLEPTYDPEAKTCSAVACHLRQSYAVPGEQELDPCVDGRTGCSDDYDPLVWGVDPVGWASCNGCHQF